MKSTDKESTMKKYRITFFAADGSQIGFPRERHTSSRERLDEMVENLRTGIDNRTRRQTAGTDSRKVARVEIEEV